MALHRAAWQRREHDANGVAGGVGPEKCPRRAGMAEGVLKPKKGEAPDKDKQAKFKEEMGKAKAELKKRAEAILTTEQKATPCIA